MPAQPGSWDAGTSEQRRRLARRQRPEPNQRLFGAGHGCGRQPPKPFVCCIMTGANLPRPGQGDMTQPDRVSRPVEKRAVSSVRRVTGGRELAVGFAACRAVPA